MILRIRYRKEPDIVEDPISSSANYPTVELGSPSLPGTLDVRADPSNKF
jgi:hypothetical protein